MLGKNLVPLHFSHANHASSCLPQIGEKVRDVKNGRVLQGQDFGVTVSIHGPGQATCTALQSRLRGLPDSSRKLPGCQLARAERSR